ncbi:unnamed protein product [Bemisia tabaci]|uniref:Uncharacterized protein n=1 Tax=Bemisia tabaci TaxID=7038 RepID=A0AAI8UU46_BEMTA|nr:unnamed protein product [Bemisia tabaci]
MKMTKMIAGRFLQGVLPKATDLVHTIHTNPAIRYSTLNIVSNKIKPALEPFRTSPTYNNRLYKNFGHKDPEPRHKPGSFIARYISCFHVFLYICPVLIFLNWKMIGQALDIHLFDDYRATENLDHLYPERPSGPLN